MAVDYVLKFPCEVRKNVPEEKLVTLVGYMSLAEFAVAEIRKSNPAVPMETILGKYEVHVNQTRPDGTTVQTPMTVGQLVAQAQSISQYRAQCSPCRANIADRPFGCIAKINYPISKESEQWLLSRLPNDSNDTNLVTLFRFLSDVKIDGRPVDTMRERLFELKEPLVRRWGVWPDQKQVTSSQIIHMLAFGGDIGPQQAALYTKLLGLAAVLSEPHPPSSNIEQFKTLMCAIVMSGRLNSAISVDA
ncbi:hypothetical protein ELE36_11910 [Pseudolysobacter antarcticus]|uniref:Uncharacterized protein n=1 Tax=Pseudolysobacter antarcticus TaxID=2511995 RepID=A0A411HKT5_9GAMM|nr:hypothetical protein [Pseudolysobacter antarcticus]QBB70997.1 hypothetical protein ELE36_11910 [Pseudolysobacter antarcticus]